MDSKETGHNIGGNQQPLAVGGVRGNSLGGNQTGINASQTPIMGNGLTHLEKLNMRLRARNSQAHQNHSMAGSSTNGMPLPLSQRSFSPPQNHLQ